MSPSTSNDNSERGYIIPIGGAEEKLNNPEILARFVEVCGGSSARIAIIPTASELEDTGRNYEKLFRKLGIPHARVLPFITREDCQSNEHLDYIESADGVFNCGCQQRLVAHPSRSSSVDEMPSACMLPAHPQVPHSCQNT
jgi:cyanophycinase